MRVTRAFLEDESGMVLGLSLWAYTIVLFTFFGGLVLSLFFADAQVRIHAYDVVEVLGNTAEFVQSVSYTDDRQRMKPLPVWMTEKADWLLRNRALPGLDEKITRFNVEKAGPHRLRVTIATEAVFSGRLLSWIGADLTRYRTVSSQDIPIQCMPSGLPKASEPKSPAIIRRHTGLLDVILLRGRGKERSEDYWNETYEATDQNGNTIIETKPMGGETNPKGCVSDPLQIDIGKRAPPFGSPERTLRTDGQEFHRDRDISRNSRGNRLR